MAALAIAVLAALPSHGGTAKEIIAAPSKPLTPEIAIKRWSIGDLRLSPDGNRVAMVVSEPAKPTGQRRDIWVYDFPGRALSQFTASAKSDTRPRWSPDGRTLAFLSNRDGENQIYLIPVDGGEARAITESKTGISSFEWAPDGKRLVFETTVPEDRRGREERKG